MIIEDPMLIAARWMARIVWGAVFMVVCAAVFVIAVAVAVGVF